MELAQLPPFVGEQFLIISSDLRGIPERPVRRAPRMLQGYEAMFSDTLYETLSPSSGPAATAGEGADLDE